MNLLVFPNQLFEFHPGLELEPDHIFLIEDSLFFGDFHQAESFHVQKLWLLRTAMKRFAGSLEKRGFELTYLDHDSSQDSLLKQLKKIQKVSKSNLATVEPVDFLLKKRLTRFAQKLGCQIEYMANPGFINLDSDNTEYRSGKKRWFMADYYKFQRQRLDVLMDGDEPVGGQWSFDQDNRKKVPKKSLANIPELPRLKEAPESKEAVDYVENRFPKAHGQLSPGLFPSSHKEAAKWLDQFLKTRWPQFGDYEDAIVEGENYLWHSVLTPMLNIGLLTPNQVLQSALSYAEKNDIPLNSYEGFIRQIIGWREFMRATYSDLGVQMRTSNHWNHNRSLPSCFYDASTGLKPIDDCIQRVLKTGYCHHIERLMVLGGFMFLCEVEPNEIYRWFMDMFVDSYDWVMVPNVYAMSQHADGGLITTKPYFSGSSYVRKMSHYARGDWCDIWDGLYWRWIWNHKDDLVKNPRWAMMCRMAEKMDSEKMEKHLAVAESYLDRLDGK